MLATRGQDQTATTPIDGQLHSIDAMSGENVELDSEGGAHAQPDKGRFLAPVVLAVLGAAGHDDDGRGLDNPVRQGVASNGFGLPVRVLAATVSSPWVASSFAGFAFSKSIYKRWIARGHQVTFPQHTEMTIDLGRR